MGRQSHWMVIVRYMVTPRTVSVKTWRRYNRSNVLPLEVSNIFLCQSQSSLVGNGCKPGHLCPEIYKALDGILFIAETKKQHEEKMRVTIYVSLSLYIYLVSNNSRYIVLNKAWRMIRDGHLYCIVLHCTALYCIVLHCRTYSVRRAQSVIDLEVVAQAHPVRCHRS